MAPYKEKQGMLSPNYNVQFHLDSSTIGETFYGSLMYSYLTLQYVPTEIVYNHGYVMLLRCQN